MGVRNPQRNSADAASTLMKGGDVEKEVSVADTDPEEPVSQLRHRRQLTGLSRHSLASHETSVDLSQLFV